MRPTARRLPSAGLLGGLCLVAATAPALAPAAAHAAPRSWSANVDPVLSEDGLSGQRVVADGRIWSLELALRHRALLRSRSLRTGKILSSVRVAIPLLRGAAGTGGDGPDLGPDLVVSGGHAAASGTWCGSYNEEERGGGDGCEETRSFFAVFSTRTGEVLRSGLSDERRHLVGGDRPSELVRRPGASSVLRDVVTRRTLMSVPRTAFSVEGAGPYVAWKTGRGPEDWRRMHVRRRGAHSDRYLLTHASVERAVGVEDDPIVEEASLAAGGSVDLEAVVDGGHAAAVDDRGRVHRLPVSLALTSGFTTRLRGDRLLLDLASDERRCARSSSWITTLGARVGNALRAVPATRGRVLDDPPSFLPGGALSWDERPRRDVAAAQRIRVVPDVHDLPLTRAQHPGC